jgi:protein tyrosine phosphatase domain-containing protein 1
LESPDEHCSCGNGNHSSGFSYDPSEFMNVGSKQGTTTIDMCSMTLFRVDAVFVYNYAMEDYGTVQVKTILNIMKVMSFAMKQGKVNKHVRF